MRPKSSSKFLKNGLHSFFPLQLLLFLAPAAGSMAANVPETSRLISVQSHVVTGYVGEWMMVR